MSGSISSSTSGAITNSGTASSAGSAISQTGTSALAGLNNNFSDFLTLLMT